MVPLVGSKILKINFSSFGKLDSTQRTELEKEFSANEIEDLKQKIKKHFADVFEAELF